MNVPDRTQVLSQLLRIFDEVRKPLLDGSGAEPSTDLQELRAGRISIERYFEQRIERSLERLTPYLDHEELEYVRQASRKYFEDDFACSGLYQLMSSRLQETRVTSHTQEGEADVNQNKSAAKKSEELGSEALQKLKAGEITVDEYLESRLENQIESLNLGRMLTDKELEKLRRLMREHFLDSPLFRLYTDAMTAPSKKNDDK